MTMCWQKSTSIDDKKHLCFCTLVHVPPHAARCWGTSPSVRGYHSFIWWHIKRYRPALMIVMTQFYVNLVNNSFSMSIITYLY